MMVAAGGVIWLNTIKRTWMSHQLPSDDYELGFPFSFYFHPPFQETLSWIVGPFEYKLFILDLWLAVSFLVFVGFVFEMVAQKRSMTRLIGGAAFIYGSSLGVFLFMYFVLGFAWRIGHSHPK